MARVLTEHGERAEQRRRASTSSWSRRSRRATAGGSAQAIKAHVETGKELARRGDRAGGRGLVSGSLIDQPGARSSKPLSADVVTGRRHRLRPGGPSRLSPAERMRRAEALQGIVRELELDVLLLAGNDYRGHKGALRWVADYNLVHRYGFAVVAPRAASPSCSCR